MLELYEFFINNRNKPLEYIILAAFLFIGDRLGRKFINSQVKRLFHVEDKSHFKQYIQNQQRIEEKLELLLQKEGITWNAHMSPPDSKDTAMKRKWSYLLLSAVLSHVHAVKRYINWRLKRMSNINKNILLPLLSAIALFAKQAFGYEVSDEYINTAADIILYLIMFAGLFIKPKKDNMPELDDME